MHKTIIMPNLRGSNLIVSILFVSIGFSFAIALVSADIALAGGGIEPSPAKTSADFMLENAEVRHITDMDVMVFEQEVDGTAGGQVPQPKGQLDGAPVLAYVFVTDLDPETVGFGPIKGTLALAVTVHPDFDDTPLWDENMDGRYDNDGAIYHTHWVVLVPDKRVGGGLSVGQFQDNDPKVVLPPTHPGMPIYLDSPGFTVRLKANRLQVIVPTYRLKGMVDFAYDAVTAYLQVNTSDPDRPMLGVYKVYDVLSGDLSLPFKTKKK